MIFCDLDRERLSHDIELVFPGWVSGDERVAIMSPHDDDGIVGAGYAALATLRNGGEVFVVIFCQGNAGYSNPEEKETIVERRKKETEEAYIDLGIPKKNIIRFDYSDFSVVQSIGWKLNNGMEGSFKKTVTLLRQLQITRVVMPNGYREHIDHEAVFKISAYDTPQAGDPILVDWGRPYPVKGVLEYSVWADFSPEDALISNREVSLRANRAIIVSEEEENKIRSGVGKYRSQGRIIESLLKTRDERKTSKGYMELYVSFDPRPKLYYKPYVDKINKMREV